MSKTLTVFGSARADAFLQLPPENVGKECNIDTKRCVIELAFAAKIPLNGVDVCIGGNGANVSVGTKRLGVESVLIAEIGQGTMSDFVFTELSKEIDCSKVSQTYGVKAGFGAILSYQGERTILSYYPPYRPQFPEDLPETPWAYLTSTGEDFEEYFESINAWIVKHNSRLVFNPGGRQIAKGKEWLQKYLSLTELLLVNREEGEEIVGMSASAGKEKELIQSIVALGCKQVVITDGGVGAFAWDGKTYMKIGSLPYNAIERTGAGDAFSTGCLAALTQGKSLAEGLMWGTCNSTSVILKIGPQAGLLKTEELQPWFDIAQKSNIKVEAF